MSVAEMHRVFSYQQRLAQAQTQSAMSRYDALAAQKYANTQKLYQSTIAYLPKTSSNSSSTSTKNSSTSTTGNSSSASKATGGYSSLTEQSDLQSKVASAERYGNSSTSSRAVASSDSTLWGNSSYKNTSSSLLSGGSYVNNVNNSYTSTLSDLVSGSLSNTSSKSINVFKTNNVVDVDSLQKATNDLAVAINNISKTYKV